VEWKVLFVAVRQWTNLIKLLRALKALVLVLLVPVAVSLSANRPQLQLASLVNRLQLVDESNQALVVVPPATGFNLCVFVISEPLSPIKWVVIPLVPFHLAVLVGQSHVVLQELVQLLVALLLPLHLPLATRFASGLGAFATAAAIAQQAKDVLNPKDNIITRGAALGRSIERVVGWRWWW